MHKHLGFTRASIVQASCHGTDNSAMLDAIAHSNGTQRGVAMVKPDVAEKELERLHVGGVRGARINFVAHLGGAPDMKAVEAVIARITPFGWHIQLHMDAHEIPLYRSFLDELKNPLAWTKISGADRITATGKPFHDAEPFVRELITAAPSQLLWGTDFPHPNATYMPNDGELVDLFAKFCDDEAKRRKILVDNATKLYRPELL